MSEFVEQSQVLTRIVNNRLRQSVELLIGSDFLWAGSEGNYTSDLVNNAHRWHNDRPAETESELAFTRLKINIYLDPLTKETGALRVLPGSHRPTFHLGLAPLEQIHHEKGDQDPFATPYGVPGTEIPFHSFESNPGDVVFFNQSLFHAVFNGFPGRRYIAVKYSAMPKTEEHFNLLKKISSFNFRPHRLFSSSENPDIRAMADRMLEAGSRIGI